MREHNLYALSAASEHYLRERMAEAQRDHLVDIATTPETRDTISGRSRQMRTLRHRLLAWVGNALVAWLFNGRTVASA